MPERSTEIALTLRPEQQQLGHGTDHRLQHIAHLGVASFEALPRDVIAQPLTRVEQMLAMPARHGLAAKRHIRLRDLDGAELIAPPAGRPHRTKLLASADASGASASADARPLSIFFPTVYATPKALLTQKP